ncbi:50S ribosomal protein L30 [uncultured archaeon]|nr:50S ribosomal protein L30 [uncultured archaeon]
MSSRESLNGKMVAVVRVRGSVHVKGDIEDTLMLMNLNHKNHATFIPYNDSTRGMLIKVNDYVTWGEVDAHIVEKVLSTRGKSAGRKALDDAYMKAHSKYATIKDYAAALSSNKASFKDVEGIIPVIRLNPPKKGFDKGGIKKPYSIGGALGYRGAKIAELIERML